MGYTESYALKITIHKTIISVKNFVRYIIAIIDFPSNSEKIATKKSKSGQNPAFNKKGVYNIPLNLIIFSQNSYVLFVSFFLHTIL